MTTKELILQYVTAHADNRWMDASELEALLTEFAEQMMKDAIKGVIDGSLRAIGLYKKLPQDRYKGYEEVKVIIIKE